MTNIKRYKGKLCRWMTLLSVMLIVSGCGMTCRNVGNLIYPSVKDKVTKGTMQQIVTNNDALSK